MYNITQQIKEFYEEAEVGIDIVEDEEIDVLTISCSGENIKNLKCSMFIEKEEMPIVSVRYFGVCVIPENKYGVMLDLVNKLNDTYKFVKFSINEDYELNIASSNFVTEENAAIVADDLCDGCLRAYDDEYSNIMRTMWKDDGYINHTLTLEDAE